MKQLPDELGLEDWDIFNEGRNRVVAEPPPQKRSQAVQRPSQTQTTFADGSNTISGSIVTNAQGWFKNYLTASPTGSSSGSVDYGLGYVSNAQSSGSSFGGAVASASQSVNISASSVAGSSSSSIGGVQLGSSAPQVTWSGGAELNYANNSSSLGGYTAVLSESSPDPLTLNIINDTVNGPNINASTSGSITESTSSVVSTNLGCMANGYSRTVNATEGP